MNARRRGCAFLGSSLAVLAVAVADTRAATWSPVASGTTQTINAIDHQSEARTWLATEGGQILRRGAGGAFELATTAPAVLQDVAFQKGAGQVGLAVGGQGTVLRSTDGGATWAAPVDKPAQIRNRCAATNDQVVPLTATTLYGISWASADVVYVVGGSKDTQSVVLKSGDGGATFQEVNALPDQRCKTNQGALSDVLALSPDRVSVISNNFGELFTSTDGFASPLTKISGMVNNAGGIPRLAIDPANPNRVWAGDHYLQGSCGKLCFQYSEDGGVNHAIIKVVNEPRPALNIWGLSYAGGTLVAAGDGGELLTSNDGRNAYVQRAGGALAQAGWRSASSYDAAHAMAGGVGGVLVATADANVLPAVAPPPSPPVTPSTPGPPVGTGKRTLRFGPAQVRLFRTVQVTGRSGRYLPMTLVTSRRCTFTVKLLRRGSKRALKTLRRTVRRGTLPVRLRLSASAGPGRYRVVVRVSGLSRKLDARVGRLDIVVR